RRRSLSCSSMTFVPPDPGPNPRLRPLSTRYSTIRVREFAASVPALVLRDAWPLATLLRMRAEAPSRQPVAWSSGAYSALILSRAALAARLEGWGRPHRCKDSHTLTVIAR